MSKYLFNISGGEPESLKEVFNETIIKLAHAVWDCKYHIGWCPKYRSRILKGEVAKSVVEISQQLCEWKKLEVLQKHVYLVLSIPLKY